MYKGTKYLRKKGTNEVFVATRHLAVREDMIPFDPETQAHTLTRPQPVIPIPEAVEVTVNLAEKDTITIPVEEPAPVEADLESLSKAEIYDYMNDTYGVEVNLNKTKREIIAYCETVIENAQAIKDIE